MGKGRQGSLYSEKVRGSIFGERKGYEALMHHSQNIKSLGFKFKHQNIKLEKLKKADEVIVTNSVFGALYVNQIEEKVWKNDLFASLIRDFIIKPEVK